MNFTQLPLPGVLAGIAVLAGVLYALQRLRVRHRPVTVVTTLFWRVAAEEAPARTLRERFRHPWAYLLILVILCLLWLAWAGPEWKQGDSGSFQVLVLDGSAGMAVGGRYAEAVAALKKQVGRLPAGQRQVFWTGGGVRTLLNPGEHALLMDRRLGSLQPVAAPDGLPALLRSLSAAARPGRTTEVVVFGDAALPADLVNLLPGIRISRASLSKRPPAANSGITALGLTDALSGAWDRVDVFLEVQGSPTQPDPRERLRLELDGRTVPSTELRAFGTGFLLSDLPAAGGLLSVRLEGDDALGLDNSARLRLPDKPRLRVLLSPTLASELSGVLSADPAVELVTADAALVVRRQGESLGAGLPSLEFVPASDSQPAFRVLHPDSFDSAAVFHHAVTAIGLREIDSMAIAQAAGRAVTAEVATAPQWRFEVWQDLLSEEFNFTQSRAFPLFIAHALRWLGGARRGPAYVAAGQPLERDALEPEDRFMDTGGRVLDPLGAAFVPEQAGDLPRAGGDRPFAVSLLDAATTLGSPGDVPVSTLPASGGPTAHPATWLLLGALVLLLVEWYLNQTGRVP